MSEVAYLEAGHARGRPCSLVTRSRRVKAPEPGKQLHPPGGHRKWISDVKDPAGSGLQARLIVVTGRVQGVGYRPFVYVRARGSWADWVGAERVGEGFYSCGRDCRAY